MGVRQARVVVLGGGTGSFTLLQALKSHFSDLTAIVNMSDDGGSTGVLRDELGVLPPGDVRQCLVALSDSPEVRNLFSYRFADGRLSGQSLGNMILSGLELQYGSFAEAVRVAGELLHIHGRVVPVTLGNHRLTLHDGRAVVKGEHRIDRHAIGNRSAVLSLDPPAALNDAAAGAIAEADVIVIAPGNMYCSILPLLVVDGMVEVFTHAKAKKVYVANLVNKPNHTHGWHVVDYVHELERYLGEGTIDTVLYNTGTLPAELQAKYAADRELPVANDPELFNGIHTQAIGDVLIASALVAQDKADQAVKRTLVRHDAERVSLLLEEIARQSYDSPKTRS